MRSLFWYILEANCISNLSPNQLTTLRISMRESLQKQFKNNAWCCYISKIMIVFELHALWCRCDLFQRCSVVTISVKVMIVRCLWSFLSRLSYANSENITTIGTNPERTEEGEKQRLESTVCACKRVNLLENRITNGHLRYTARPVWIYRPQATPRFYLSTMLCVNVTTGSDESTQPFESSTRSSKCYCTRMTFEVHR